MRLISQEDMSINMDDYIDLLKRINREGFDVDKLVNKLENSGFFSSPATTKYHYSFPGGLCEHSLDVTYNLIRLMCNKKHLDMEEFMQCGEDDEMYPLLQSCLVVGLLHDICKMGKFELTTKNQKKYSENGKYSDNFGKYDWESVYEYKYKENQFVYGTDGETSEYMARQFINLSVEESVAIINSSGDVDGNSNKGIPLASIYSKYELAVMLHCADMLSCYIDGKNE